MNKTDKIFYGWLLGGFVLVMLGVVVFNFVSQGLGLAFAAVGTAEFLIPYVVYAQHLLRKKVNEHFKKREVD